MNRKLHLLNRRRNNILLSRHVRAVSLRHVPHQYVCVNVKKEVQKDERIETPVVEKTNEKVEKAGKAEVIRQVKKQPTAEEKKEQKRLEKQAKNQKAKAKKARKYQEKGLRKTDQTEDQDRVENNVRERAGQLGDHGIDRAAGRLQEALEGDLDENAERAQNADVQIRDAVIDNGLDIRLRAHIGTDADQACDKHEQIAQQRQQQTIDRDLIDTLGVFLAQRTREQRVDADAEANGNSDDDVLPRKSHRHRRERILADTRDENTVHDVVQCLHEHGNHHWHRHRQQQLVLGHCAHFIFAKGFFRHIVTPKSICKQSQTSRMFIIGCPQRNVKACRIFHLKTTCGRVIIIAIVGLVHW